ncbi:dihydrodipicolinate synthase family protein [Phreatobacter sp.]|uniref:dihydrodipicolinate synthase family protein n=1 Tax=Phreatobacter sp. TaxID=1966341 RepID=UPI0022BF20EA|nr:dihydrodipicolinate synthase family protein [Phreatobacter sp.]MCZ8314258.1 dihydrodipicolinate synthase family protein [Phreatobacter sp.]
MTIIADRLRGIHAATIVPMTTGFAVDEARLSEHIAAVSHVPGIRGLLVNGHAGENFVLSSAEKRRVVEIARKVAPADCLICSGVNAESSLMAAEDARAAEDAGADILLVFPPNAFALSHDPAAVLLHHEIIAGGCSLPLLVYGAPVGAGHMAYRPEVLTALAANPRFVGVKEGSWEVATYEQNLRLLKAARPDFVVMGSGDEHLLTSYIIGSAGSQVSLAAVAPELCAAFFAAADAGDWAEARLLHERIYPLAVAIYRDAPGGRATARLKACLQLLGRLPNAVVRPPQPPATATEIATLTKALAAAGVA